MTKFSFSVVIPAAGIGKRVGASLPKQYLKLLDRTIIEHSILPFIAHPEIKKVIVSIAKNDRWFTHLPMASHPKIHLVEGGRERVDSVMNALTTLPDDEFVLVHDAARPCVQVSDIDKLLQHAKVTRTGAILAYRVRDTMKRADIMGSIKHSVDRQNLWHALTPQLFNKQDLSEAIASVDARHKVTDEASAMEMSGQKVTIIEGRSDNIKVTQAEDLRLAEFYLSKF